MHPQPPVPTLGSALAGLTDGLAARAESDRILAPLFLALAALLRRLITRFDTLVALHNAGLLLPCPAPQPAPAPFPCARTASPQPPAAPSASWRDLFAWWRSGAQAEWPPLPRTPRARPRLRAGAAGSTRASAPRATAPTPRESPSASPESRRPRARQRPAQGAFVRAHRTARTSARAAPPPPREKTAHRC